MKRATAGGRRLPFRWMMATGRTRPADRERHRRRASGCRPPWPPPGRGRMLTPAAMAIACLIVSMLSNCITTSTRTPACRSTRSMARRIGEVVVEGDEPLALEVGRLGRRAGGRAGGSGGRPAPSAPRGAAAPRAPGSPGGTTGSRGRPRRRGPPRPPCGGAGTRAGRARWGCIAMNGCMWRLMSWRPTE